MDEYPDLKQQPVHASFDPGSSPTDVTDWNVSLRGIRHSIAQRRVLILAIAVLGLLCGVVSAVLPRHYESTSRLQVRPGSANQYKLDPEELLGSGDTSTKMESETAVLRSDSLLLDMAKALHLQNDPEFVSRSHLGQSLDDPEARDSILKKLRKAVTITHLPRTEVIFVSAKSQSPKLSADMVNVLVKEYIEHLFQSRFSSTKRVADWLSGQLDELKEKVENDQERLVQLQAKLGVVGLDQNQNLDVTELEDLTKASDEAEVTRIIAEARYRTLDSGDINLLEGGQDILGRNVPGNSQLTLLGNLRTQRAQAESQYATLAAQFGANYPQVVQVKAQIAALNREISDEERRVLNQSRQAFNAAQRDERTTTAALDRQRDIAYQKHSDMVKYQILLHDFESSRSLYEGLLQRLEQASIVSGLESSDVDIYDMALIPSTPIEMNRFSAICLGVVLGLVCGIVLAIVLGQFDNRLHDLSEIESELQLPLLSITPSLKASRKDGDPQAKISTSTDIAELFKSAAGNPFVESIWSLRSSIMLSSPGRPPKLIVLTSCNPEEGKSTFSCGLACAFALRHSRVLVIDGDMRRPTLSGRFHVSNSVGLSSVLTGSASLAQAILPVPEMPGLSILPAGPIPPAPASILDTKEMSALVEDVRSNFDFIVIDSPPALGLADASLLGQFADAIILVLSYADPSKSQVRRAKSMLGRTGRPITGIALNFFPLDTMGYYGYGYGYSKYSQENQEVS
jgi:capsular exopolysaccharide synthesis family protein